MLFHIRDGAVVLTCVREIPVFILQFNLIAGTSTTRLLLMMTLFNSSVLITDTVESVNEKLFRKVGQNNRKTGGQWRGNNINAVFKITFEFKKKKVF